jgi:hypothetical protein
VNNYPCELIEDLIPLYIEEDISSITKEIVEDHLKECESCNALVQEYSNNELNIEDLKEDLPQANTFKKWMKRLKVWGAVTSILFLLALIATGAFGYKIGEKSKNNLLTLKTVVKSFNAKGLALKENKSKLADDYILDGVKPAVYNIGETDDTLLIYIFKSFGEKKDILNKTDNFKDPFTLEERPFHAKNSLIVFMPSKMPESRDELKSIGQALNIISNVVFEDLNEGQERVHKGESESWEGTLTLRYYQHWFEEDGKLLYDSYYEKIPALQYKKYDIGNVGPITFKYEAGSSSGSSEGFTINDEGYVELGRSGGTGAILSEDAEIRFTVKWGDKEEHMVLKAQEVN